MTFEKIIFENRDGVGIITLNDPANRNTISGSIVPEIAQCLDDCSDNQQVRAIVIRGAGPAFSAGGNINVMKNRIETGNFDDVAPSMRRLGLVVAKMRNIRKPVIASVHGAAAGGGFSLILHCDFRIVTEDAKFVLPFVNLGLIPDCGGILPLLRMIGIAKTTELLMTAKLLKGNEAYEWGLANQAVPADKLEEATMKFAKKLANGPTLAYGNIKVMINRLAYEGFDWQLENESEIQQLLFKSDDHKEGAFSFLEKRKPAFKGK